MIYESNKDQQEALFSLNLFSNHPLHIVHSPTNAILLNLEKFSFTLEYT